MQYTLSDLFKLMVLVGIAFGIWEHGYRLGTDVEANRYASRRDYFQGLQELANRMDEFERRAENHRQPIER